MSKAFGIFLIGLGGLWALIGLANLISAWGNTELSSTVQVFGLILNMILFILPGMICAGIGTRLHQ